MSQKQAQWAFLNLLEQTVAESCLCKLRESCLDKSSIDCLNHKNIYAIEALNKSRKN
jgi:hypothetical protein